MSNNGNHITYTAEDIKKYLTGKMTPAEMHAIELAALDDPFLAEAMEGYELIEEKEWHGTLNTLKTIAQPRDTTPVIALQKKSQFSGWKAAAAILVVCVSAITAYIFTGNTKNTSTELAKVELTKNNVADAQLTDSTSNQAGTLAESNPYQKEDAANSFLNTNPEPGASITLSENYKPAADSHFIYQPAPSAAASKNDYAGNGNNSQFDFAVNDKKESREPQAEEKLNESTASNLATNTQLTELTVNRNASDTRKDATDKITNFNNAVSTNNFFNGTVLSQDNKPVGYATLKSTALKQAVRTDANGNFKIPATDSTITVSIVSAGYSPQRITLQSGKSQNVIVLQSQDVAVQAISAGTKRENGRAKAKALADSIAMADTEEDDAAPAMGWDEYNNYLSNNMQFPEEARQKNLHGEVEVFVKLKNNGEISQIKVAKPLCPECDAEAVRLVMEGPKWEVKNTRKKNKVKVTVRF